MYSNVPWKELAVAGAALLSASFVIGWLTGAENLHKKKRQARGPSGAEQEEKSVAAQECEALFGMADAAMARRAFTEAEAAYTKALEITEHSSDPHMALFPLFAHRSLAEVYEHTGQPAKAVEHLEFCIDYFMTKDELTKEQLQALVGMVDQAIDFCVMGNAPPNVKAKFVAIRQLTESKLNN